MTSPFTGLRIVELGSKTAAPYLGKLFVDGGADLVKIESPRGDPFRRWSASGSPIPAGEDAAWFRFLNAGKRSVVIDLDAPSGLDELTSWVQNADLVIDDHQPGVARALGIAAASLRAMNPAAVITTITPFGSTGPWVDRAANDFTLQALTGSTNGRGVPGDEPFYVGGELGAFVTASLSAAPIAAAAIAARTSGAGAHFDISQFESMMWAFTVFRGLYDEFAPEYRPARQIEVPSIEPAADGMVAFTTVTGQQWLDFCAMIGAPELGEDPDLQSFDGRMRRRDEVWQKIRAYTTTQSVNDLVELAAAFRIPTGPVGTGDVIAEFDHFVENDVFVESAHGFTQPKPPYTFSLSTLAPLRAAPALGASDGDPAAWAAEEGGPTLGDDVRQPLRGYKVLDLTAYFAGPYATNQLRALGADLVKVESHVKLDGMRWASGLTKDQLWEWSPAYHGVNIGKRVVNLDLGTETGRAILEKLIARADVVIENFSPRVMENWGLTWERIQEINPKTILVRMPAFGTTGPWRDRVGFAMTMEQISGLANRAGRPDALPLNPRGPVDFIAGSHAALAVVMALADRERTGSPQVVEVPLINGALQAAAEQPVEYSAYGEVLTRMGNRSPSASPQGMYQTLGHDEWLAISIETDEQWQMLTEVVGADLSGLSRVADVDRIDEVLRSWSSQRPMGTAAHALAQAGIPAAPGVHFNDAQHASPLRQRGFYRWLHHAVTGWGPYAHLPFQIDGAYLPLGDAPPTLGQHTDEILTELGLTSDEIAQLHEQGITGDWPAMVPRPDRPQVEP